MTDKGKLTPALPAEILNMAWIMMLDQNIMGYRGGCLSAVERQADIVALDFGNPPTNNSLYEEIIYLAQQKSYKIRIFDEVDTQLAQALEENYASWFEAENDNKTTELMRQKNNLND